MNASDKVARYLSEAKTSEDALTRVLQSQIAMTPAGDYRDALTTHLEETRQHSRRVARRIRELIGTPSPLRFAAIVTEEAVGQGLALAKTPLDLLRGSGSEEKVLKNAKDAAATEALEIATYTAIERLANNVDDEQTAELARSIRVEEQAMLDRILHEIPSLTDAVARADVDGVETLPDEEPWPGYDELTVAEIEKALDSRSEDQVRALRAYEAAHKNRAGVLKATERELA
jgi:ferritin-like metal-binding protein YciE